MSMPSVLAFFAHPDDEALSAGGVLARHAAAGARTAVLTGTWAAGTGRVGELARALAILGAGAPRLLGYADARVPSSAPGRSRFCEAPLDEAVGAVVAHIREFRPHVVITHDGYGGLTGHPDHIHAHRLAVIAVHAAGLGRLYPDAGNPWQPSTLCLATHPHSAARALGGYLLRPDGAVASAYSVPDETATAVDVSPWVEQKLAAIAAHRSEVERGAAPGRIAALAPEVQRRVMGTEWYVRHDLAPTAGRA
ncbi:MULTISPECIES: PIG-L deacetylase family protein [unclassified Streptomyces]|uniref:PIG-L deacetylase family protein n=1 Tax=unclassified Streptomyces TaxID=2593676 RepID=UPI002E0F21BE|nr:MULTISPECIES: PIG-L deacetylase family protein [unclassified Streptomyces]WSR28997.1 PIG-L family deacetylase [Streptomyces sp. NBC_01205]